MKRFHIIVISMFLALTSWVSMRGQEISFTSEKEIGATLRMRIISSTEVKPIEGLEIASKMGEWYTFTKTSEKMKFKGDISLFYCFNNKLKTLELNNCSNLLKLNCDRNVLSTLLINGSDNLEKLSCYKNKLKELKLSKNTQLTHLDCYENQLENLDLGACLKLKVLACYKNKIQNLNVNKQKDLLSLMCDDNQIENLDVSGLSNLKVFSANNNKIKSLDFSTCPSINTIECNSNKVENLNVDACNKLTQIFCFNNQLENLNLKDCSQLLILKCSKNKLQKLDLSNSHKLTNLECSQNSIKSINVKNCSLLSDLNCCNNQIFGKAMTDLVTELPNRTKEREGEFYVVNLEDKNEKNICLESDVAILKAKNWRVLEKKEDDWIDYNGSKPNKLKIIRKEDFQLYPNPVKEFAHIKSVHKGDNIVVFNLMGEILFQQKSYLDGLFKIDAHLLSNGIYIVKCGEKSLKFEVRK